VPVYIESRLDFAIGTGTEQATCGRESSDPALERIAPDVALTQLQIETTLSTASPFGPGLGIGKPVTLALLSE